MNNTEKLSKFRNALSKFVEFDALEWEIFCAHIQFSTLKKKEYFATEGKVCTDMGFIASGGVRYYYLKDGVEITGYFSFEHDFVSSYKSFLTGEPCLNNIQALEETELILISKDNIHALQNHPKLAYKMERFGRLMAEYYICCYEDRVTAFITQTAEERYLDMERTAKALFQKIPQHYIANFLGITPVSLSRIRKRTLLQKA
ncbi:Crp/Fnr family transcriptional regulator [Pedobacter sp. AW1-32]|uniref:Crp/Fnr family transcriptional regulator n=1 Tax=Pedobacter sp. AW1-32 TaxID=3383026 RepID=UPI003FEDD100